MKRRKSSKGIIFVMVVIIVAAGAFLAGQLWDIDLPWVESSSGSEGSEPSIESSAQSSEESSLPSSSESEESGEESSNIESESSQESSEESSAESSEESSEADESYEYIEKTEADIGRGDLILVNRDHEYVFGDSDEEEFFSIYQYKNKNYKVKNITVSARMKVIEAMNSMFDDFMAATGKKDVNIISGYRTFDSQKSLYDRRVESEGVEATDKYTALPGFSEHHSGYAVDFAIYTSEGLYYDFYGQDEYKWVLDHCYEYGFIERYQKEKKELTGFEAEPWHFRYVGAPHAYAMYDKELCHEEYMELLKGYTFEGEHLKIKDHDGVEYEIYYVEGTSVPVPKGAEYEISGDNESGFIVTIKRG